MNGASLQDECLDQLEKLVGRLLNGRLREFRLVHGNEGLILRGRAQSYYAKQLAQQAVLDASNLRIAANEIEVS